MVDVDRREWALFRDAAIVSSRPEVRTLRLSGPDRARFLNGQITNDVSKLQAGEGVLAVKASQKGRVEGVLRVRAGEDALLLDALDDVAPKLLATLAKYIIMDDCSLAEASQERDVLVLAGPKAEEVLQKLALAAPAKVHGFVKTGGVSVIRDRTLGFLAYELHVPAGQGLQLQELARSSGAERVSRLVLDAARVEAGWPIDGRDLDEDSFPMEAGLDEAISYTKGCYIGQETIARAKHLGHMNYALRGVIFDGEPAPERTPLVQGEKTVGELRSVVRSPSLDKAVGLAYVRTSVAEGAILSAGEAQAKVARLPFAK